PQNAIDSLLNVLAIEDEHRVALAALPRLYIVNDAYDRAVDTLARHAALEGDKGASLYADAGRLATNHLSDPELAQRYFESALGLDPESLPALTGLGAL